MQLVEEFGLRQLVVIGNVQGDDALVLESFREPLAEAVHVGLLHEEDYVGPADMPLGDDDGGIGLRAGGAHLNAGKPAEDAFGREAPNPIPAVDEQEFQWKRLRLEVAAIERVELYGVIWKKAALVRNALPLKKL